MASPKAKKTVAYLRLSTVDQDIEKNNADILHFANQRDLGKVTFVGETASGRTPWRERKVCVISAILLYANRALANCPLPDPEKEDIIQYRNGYSAVLGPPEAKLPFYLRVSSDGTGYLVDSNGLQAEEGISPNVSREECNRSRAWKDLSKTVCEKNWGKLKKLKINGALPVDFATFDIPSDRIGERNIYHLDIVFNEKTWLPFLYRVRGIGINNAKFIQASKEEKVISPFSQ